MVSKLAKLIWSFLFLCLPIDSFAQNVATDSSSFFPNQLFLDIAKLEQRLIVVGERGAILYSDDQGNNWHKAKTPTSRTLTAVHFIAQLGWAVGHDAIILHSKDGGLSWQQQYSDSDYAAPLLDIYFTDAQQGYAIGAYGLILRTTDAGQSWLDWRQYLDNPEELHLNAIQGSANHLYIVGEQGILYRSVDAGLTWQKLPSPDTASFFNILIQPATQSISVFGLSGKIYVSNDQGDSWGKHSVTSPTAILHGIQLKNNQTVWVGQYGSVISSERTSPIFWHKQRKAFTAAIENDKGELILIGQNGLWKTSLNQLK